MTKPEICLENVRFAYPGAAPLFEGVDLDVYPGELVCMVGPNGGGKSTLLKLILGELQPVSGTVLVGGAPAVERRRKLGYMPQSIHWDPEFPVDVEDVVLTGRCGFGRVSADDRAAAEEALAIVGMEAARRTPFADLSGGMRQRVLLARALGARPDILLMDEPTANVDPGNARQINQALEAIQGRVTCVLVSHDMEFVTSLAKQVVCVHHRLDIHPTESFRSDHAEELFGSAMRRVVHERNLPSTGHTHD